MKFVFRAVLTFVLLAGPLVSGVIYEYEIKAHNESGIRTSERRILVEDGRLRSDFGAGGAEPPVVTVLFHVDSKRMMTLVHEDKSYLEINEEYVDLMSKAVAEAKEALQNLPTEQRERLEKLMNSGSQEAIEPLRIRATDRRTTVSGYSCEIRDVYRGDQKLRELCVAAWNDVPGALSTGTAIQRMQDLGKQMLSTAQQGLPTTQLPNPFAYWDQVNGFVVASRSFRDGKLHLESTLTTVQQLAIDPAEFDPPPDYERQTLLEPGP
jgi:hypothetical protein